MSELNPFLKRIDDRLHELREKRPWLADKSGIKVRTINSWFLNDRYPTVDNAAKIADALGVSVDYLITGEEPERRYADARIAEIIDYLEGLRSNELEQTYGMIKLARLLKLTDDEKLSGVRERA